MKITPLEIRQKTFEKIFRGYDKDEVNSFLNFLSQEWDKVMDENKLLQIKLQQSEKESAKLRQVEDSLFKTLKSAEDTGASIIEQANKTAELILKEANMNAEELQTGSRNQAKDILDSADAQARTIMEDLREDVAALIESYETLLAQREIVLKNLKNIATETLENVNFAKEELKRIDVTAHARVVKELNRQSSYSLASDRANKENKQTIITNLEPEPDPELKIVQVPEKKEDPSPQMDEVEEVNKSVELEGEPEAQREEPEEEEKWQEQVPKKPESGSFFDQFE
jgi:cell division initiation protein